jgi:hypothetical protein
MKKSNNDIIWLKALEISFANPIILKELIPFFKDRKWVKSVYGMESDLRTKEWGDLVLTQEKLKKAEIDTVRDILSRKKLIYTPENRLNIFLESIYNKNLPNDVIETLLLSIQSADEQCFYSLDILLKVFNLTMASKLSIDIGFTLIEEALVSIPYLNHEKNAFDPVFHLLQTLPLVDFGTSDLYNQWNEKRNALLQGWCSMDAEIHIRKNNVLEILPYEVVKNSLEYSHLFKLICEQYIEEKVTIEEFKDEVKEISLSAAQKFKSQKLKAYEDPCLICINDLTFLLKNKNKRIRAYEAFKFLLQMQVKSPLIVEQQYYFELRRKTEDQITAKKNLMENNKIIYSAYLNSLSYYLRTLFETLPQNLHVQDPILDALELESITLPDKLELQVGWYHAVNNSNCNIHQALKIKSYIDFEKTQLPEKDVENNLHKMTLSLKNAMKSLTDEKIMKEIELITGTAFYYLSKEKTVEVIHYMEKTLGLNIPFNYTKK